MLTADCPECNNATVQVSSKNALYQALPSVDEVLHTPEVATLIQQEGQPPVVEATRKVLSRLREEITSGHLSSEDSVQLAIAGLAPSIARELNSALEFSLKPVINATGVILHTNLGRAPLAASALQRISQVAGGYSNLEFDVAVGARGKRDVHVER